MMEINPCTLLIAALAYYGIGMFGLRLLRKMVEVTESGKVLYGGLLAESIAMIVGTAGIVLTLAHVPIDEALLATGALGFCYTVVMSLVQPTSGSVPLLGRMIMGGYRLLGILCITFVLYQWG